MAKQNKKNSVSSQKKHIAVIGAGYTGLTAAYELLKKGYRVTIFEKSSHVGGLAGDFTIEGEPLEKAYHHLFKTDKDILGLVEELGIQEKLEWRDSSVSIYYGGKLYPFVTPIDLLKFTPLRPWNRIRTGLVALFLQKYKNWSTFTHVTAYDWMKKWNGKNAMDVIWEPLLKGKFDTYYKKVAMAWLWARIHIRANSKEKGDAKEKLGYFNGGFQVVTQALVKHIKDMKGTIKTNVSIESLDYDKKTKKAIVTIASKKHEFDEIIATVPTHVFGKLTSTSTFITKKYQSQLQSIDYLGAALLIFSSDQDLSKYYWHNINDLQSPFLVFINHTKLVGTHRYNGKNIYYIGSYIPHTHEYFAMEDKDIKKKWYAYLKTVFPDFDAKQINEENVFKFPFAQHIVDTSYQEKIPEYQSPIPHVFLANFSQIFPEDRGTNYAVREGKKIAAMVTE